jgi:predicted dinucleotide-binding enzyme
MQVTIVGNGSMARGIATRALAGRHDVVIAGRTEARAKSLVERLDSAGRARSQSIDQPIAGDLVVLAVPYLAAGEVLVRLRSHLTGKILVDITNPVNETVDGLITPFGSSAAEQIARQVPSGTTVVKAFNTNFARTLLSGEVSGQPLDVFIAGDDADATSDVADLVRDGQMRPVVVGPLSRARQLEQLALLGMLIQQPLGLGFESGWKLVPAGPGAGQGSRSQTSGQWAGR